MGTDRVDAAHHTNNIILNQMAGGRGGHNGVAAAHTNAADSQIRHQTAVHHSVGGARTVPNRPLPDV